MAPMNGHHTTRWIVNAPSCCTYYIHDMPWPALNWANLHRCHSISHFTFQTKKVSKNSVGLQTGKSMVSTMLTYHCRHENCHRFAVNPRFSSTKTLLIHLIDIAYISCHILTNQSSNFHFSCWIPKFGLVYGDLHLKAPCLKCLVILPYPAEDGNPGSQTKRFLSQAGWEGGKEKASPASLHSYHWGFNGILMQFTGIFHGV